ncbi:MAG: FtsW/RodA/SpoVE family cell cycle protein, partial [Firmicutes bacterium]|nr:FtsW/RodA/SpoVE family cell cycle protein [Bacillota bacterium]
QIIPASHTDYIFAVIAEEMGLLGTFSLLIIYLALAFWGFLILKNEKDERIRATGAGLIFLFHFQVLLVLGGMLRFLPFTGMTLPFVSYGSSSLAAQFWMLGILTKLGGKRR